LKQPQVPIYLDYNATTPCAPEVIDVMLPYLREHFGNASSEHHPYGWYTKDAITEATNQMAKRLGVSRKELIYTSGATESINSILKGVFTHNQSARNQIITVKTEHKAVLDVCKYLERQGAEVVYLNVSGDGLIDLEDLAQKLSDQTLITAIMFANNETGVIQPIAEIAQRCRENGSLFFSDATQALGKLDLTTFFQEVDFACFSGHKLYGPKGIGLTYCKEAHLKQLDPFVHGGGQQRAMRGGTYNTPAIMGLAKAMEIATERRTSFMEKLSSLRDRLQTGLSQIEESYINGAEAPRLPNTLNISFKYVDGEGLLRTLGKDIAVSNGSACNSASVNPSHVLTAMGHSESLAFSSLRFSLGEGTTEEEIDRCIEVVTAAVAQLRASNILWERR